MAFTLAIAGRPNVGKSTLFNRLTGRRSALVDDSPGVTRDRREGDASLAGLQFRVVDTAGLLQAEPGTLEAAVQAQTDKALAHADAVLFLVDARTGILPEDRAIANRLRRSGKRIILAANKCEGRIALSGLGEAHALGLGEPIGLSAEHAIGLEELADTLAALMGKPAGTEEDAPLPDAPLPDAPLPDAPDGETEDEEAQKDLRVAIVGRPNAGKSTLVNRLIGEERLVTSPIAGTTRDAIEIDWLYEGAPVKLFDTAGMRKRGKVAEKIEKLSVADALRAIRFAHVVVLLTDAETPLEKQDLAIADLAEREGRAVVIAVNKWDLVEDKQKRLAHLKRQADVLLPQLKGAPFVCLSAETGRGVELLMPAVFEAYRVWTQRVSTSELNRWLTAALERHPPPAISGRRIKLRYMTQVKARPPTFALFGNQLSALPDEYIRYLVNGLREHFGFPGTPMRMWRRGNDNPYADEK